MTDIYPPDFDFTRLSLKATIDFITISDLQPGLMEFEHGKRAKWIRNDPESDSPAGSLTLQDPSPGDIWLLHEHYPKASIMEIEISIDFWPTPECSAEERQTLIDHTMRAIAGRMRPEEANPFAFGLRACVTANGSTPQPFHDRQAPPEAQLLWGVRGDFIQVKAYPKKTDQRQRLPMEKCRPRIEVAMRRGHLMDLDLNHPIDVLTHDWRTLVSPYFRFIARAELRSRRSIKPSLAMQAKVSRAWRRGGAGGFKQAEIPEQAHGLTREAIEYRARRQVSLRSVKLVRHRRANELVGNALRQLERRLRGARNSGEEVRGRHGGSQR